MKAKALGTLIAAGGMAVGVTACSPAVSMCTVRHHYAIVVFQNGGASVGKTLVKQFRLNVKYSPFYTQRTIKYTHFSLKPARGKPHIVVKTYRVGRARGCHVDHIKTNQ